MWSLPAGFLAMIVIVFFSVERDAWGLYVNEHSIILVVGGTIALLWFTTPWSGIVSLIKCLRELFHKEPSLTEFTEEFKSLSQNKKLQSPSKNALINFAADLWAQGVSPDLFMVLLSQKRSELDEMYLDAIQSLRNLSKYPPAMGMTGTVVGMVALFSQLDTGDKGGIGPALALAMTATFFGLVVSNVLVMPLADRLGVRYLQTKRYFKNTYQILALINQGEAISLVEDEVAHRAAG